MISLNYLSRHPVSITLLTVLCLKLVLIFIVLPWVSDVLFPLYRQNVFPDAYDKIALNLAEGNGYRFYPDTALTLMREPGYPVFLAVLFWLFGYSLAAAKFANVLLAICAAWIVTRLSRRFYDSETFVIVSALLFLFHPGIIFAESRGGFELLFILSSLLFILALFRALNTHRRSDYLIAGVLLGLSVLVRSTLVFFPFFVFFYLVLFNRRTLGWQAIFSNVGILVLALFITMSPWIIRNYAVVGQFVPTASVKGDSAYIGQYICKHLSFSTSRKALDAEAMEKLTEKARAQGLSFKGGGYYRYFYEARDEVAFSATQLADVYKEYMESPSLLLKCASQNIFNFWFAGRTWPATALNVLLQLPYLLAAAFGAYLLIKAGYGRAVALLLLFILYYFAVHVPVLAHSRYNLPLIPLLSILAPASLWVLVGKRLRPRHVPPEKEVG